MQKKKIFIVVARLLVGAICICSLKNGNIYRAILCVLVYNLINIIFKSFLNNDYLLEINDIGHPLVRDGRWDYFCPPLPNKFRK